MRSTLQGVVGAVGSGIKDIKAIVDMTGEIVQYVRREVPYLL